MNWADYFDYDEACPSCLRWKSGKPAGGVGSQGYYTVKVEGKKYACHRIIWEMHNSKIEPGLQIDHIDGVRSSNKLVNLRLVSVRMNQRNKRQPSNNKSGVTGVIKLRPQGRPERWRACWVDENGVACTKTFSVSKYGDVDAFLLACQFRALKMLEINTNGAGYSERHGGK